MDVERQESYCKHISELENDEGKDIAHIISVYDDWSKDYDKDISFYQFNTFKTLVNLLAKVMKSEKHISMNCSILDVCAGTGLVGEYLKGSGFKGQIDAHDGSPKMLEIAKTKGVYTRFFCHIIEPDTDMPVELSKSSYDVTIACSCFWPKRLHWMSLKHLVNAVRIGGLIVFGLRRRMKQKVFDYNVEVEKEIFRLENMGVLKLIDVHFNAQYRKEEDEANVSKTFGCMEYCFQKLSDYSN